MNNKFLQLESKKDLCDFFSIPNHLLDNILNWEYIKTTKIPKKKWGYRIINYTEFSDYLNLLDEIKNNLDKIYHPPSNVHWFINKRSNITNASKHLNKSIVINIDIKKFFDSITKEKIKNCFINKNINDNISEILSSIVTHNWILPMWFPTSPLISNIIFEEIDYKLDEYCSSIWYEYTRYCDDLTFSSNTKNILKKEDIESILSAHWFTINNKKYRIQKKWGNQYVTWLTVCEKDKPRIPKKF